MNKASDFAVGDIVRVLPTATRQKYEGLPPAPGWDASMQRDIGQTGTITHIYDSGHIRVKVPATSGGWIWKSEDLTLSGFSKWRRGPTCAN